ncbi:DUF4232 domain-containing protein [Plantactinospora sp. KBS50]|uniref:DUF4232 domain-containing protein n=1 Tax=Plantactinospora sp. KBS50 TaxID=2024580 RepID=UPI0012FE708B|nr:DUF4232 domain-containing protein [Plantactinospora sp. KBS50]
MKATSQQRVRTAVACAAGVAAVLLGGAACTSTDQPPTATGTTPASTGSTAGTPSAGVTDSAAPSPGGHSGGTAGTAECKSPQLTVALGESGGATGHWAQVLLFTNTGPAACNLQGYPGVAGLDPSGKQLAQASRTPAGWAGGLSSQSGTPPLVKLAAKGGVASAMLEGTNIPSGDATDCPEYKGLLVTPPDETHSVRLAGGGRGCDGFQIHPVVPGRDGTERE